MYSLTPCLVGVIDISKSMDFLSFAIAMTAKKERKKTSQMSTTDFHRNQHHSDGQSVAKAVTLTNGMMGEITREKVSTNCTFGTKR